MPTTAERFELARAAHRPTIRYFARNALRSPSMRFMAEEDVQQELLLTLWDCCETYDPNRGARFNTLVQRSFTRKVITLVRYAERQCRDRRNETISLDNDAIGAVVEGILAGRGTVSAEDLAIAYMSIKKRAARQGVSEYVEALL